MPDALRFPCVICGAITTVDQTKTRRGHIYRLRLCACGEKFYTRQNGGGEIFHCYEVGVNRGSIEYREMVRRYQKLRTITDDYGSRKISQILERARQKAGIL